MWAFASQCTSFGAYLQPTCIYIYVHIHIYIICIRILRIRDFKVSRLLGALEISQRVRLWVEDLEVRVEVGTSG